ncbi:MAG TPA: hypothetical protein DCM05_07055 [Elusimicrobia bacterium]|nr:hypothetical protein [Elusimicrobiota bacterium]
MTRKTGQAEEGQVLVGVLLVLIVLLTLVPVMVIFTQHESRWSVKQDQNTNAFHLAEAGVEKGYRALTTSTNTWLDLVDHAAPIIQIDRMKFDFKFDDVPGGYYAVSITSGPETKQATIISVGKDEKNKETRAIRVVYVENTMGDIAIQGMNGVSVSGGVNVEWGGIVSPKPVNFGSLTSPQIWSASSLNVDSDPLPPNCDSKCCQWHSYDGDVPPDPSVDLDFYRDSATASSTYYGTAQSWSSFDYTGGGTVFIENNLTLASPGVNVLGNLIITGNLTTASGAWGKGSATMLIPQTAWKQYCNNWSFYRTNFDGAAAATFPGLTSTYKSLNTLTYTPTPNGKTSVQGFLYVGGNVAIGGGGGSSNVYGNFFCLGTITVGSMSNVTVYYNKVSASGIRTSKVNLARESWRAVLYQWPTDL